MTTRDDDFDPRSGRVHHGNQGSKRPKSFVGEVMRAAKKAGHRGQTFRRSSGTAGISTFGRGRRAALSLASRSSSWPGSYAIVRAAFFPAALETSRLPQARRRHQAQKPMRRTASCPFGAGLPRIAWQFYCSIAAV